jgi:predicted AlkP superfamily pyrophosphatase or phosphodiesterase
MGTTASQAGRGARARRVVYIIVDGMRTDAFEEVAASGAAPAFAFLKEHAGYVRDSVAIFPTITPCATASLLTGAMPHEHRIPGMCWYDHETRRFVNYGQSPRVAVLKGISQMVEEYLVNLNERHLSREVKTLHENLHELGLTSASINFMIFRGPFRHKTRPNVLEKFLFRKKLPRSMVGPKEHYFADVVNGRVEACSKLISTRGFEKRLQATDAWAACVTRDLLEKDAADMIVFYLHENDHSSHRAGPGSQYENLIKADKHVAHVLDAFSSWERALDEVGFVITADHAQSPVSDDKDHILALEEILGDFSQVDPSRGKDPFEDKEVACAGNGRMGFVYLNADRKKELHDRVRRALVESPGIDQVMFKAGSTYVVSGDRGEIRFRAGAGNGDLVSDGRGNRWSFEGDLEVVAGVVDDGSIRTPEYPLAMWRASSALDLERCGDFIVTTKLGWELTDLAGADHRGGGDHGSLHAQDSIVPFLSTLADPPLRPATIDVAPHIYRHFEGLTG